MSKNYFTTISDLISELLSRPGIDVAAYQVRSGFPEQHLKLLEETSGLLFAEPVKSFYKQVGEVEITWYGETRLPGSDDNIHGEVYLQRIDRSLGLDNYNEYWLKRVDEQSKRQYPDWIPRFKPFDFFNSDEIEMVGFIAEGNTLTDNLAYYKENIGFAELNINLEQYIERMVESKGLAGWQNALWVKEYDTFLQDVKQAFP
jgi:hypothetical protein